MGLKILRYLNPETGEYSDDVTLKVIGDLSKLLTSSKDSLVEAINSIQTGGGEISSSVLEKLNLVEDKVNNLFIEPFDERQLEEFKKLVDSNVLETIKQSFNEFSEENIEEYNRLIDEAKSDIQNNITFLENESKVNKETVERIKEDLASSKQKIESAEQNYIQISQNIDDIAKKITSKIDSSYFDLLNASLVESSTSLEQAKESIETIIREKRLDYTDEQMIESIARLRLLSGLIEQRVSRSEMSDAIRSIDLIGANLLKDSRELNGAWNLSSGSIQVLTDEYNNARIAKVDNERGYLTYVVNDLKIGETYNFSIGSKVDNESGLSKVVFQHGSELLDLKDNQENTVVGVNFKRYSSPFVASRNTETLVIKMVGLSNNRGYLVAPKLEKGERARDWQPHIDDPYIQIKRAESAIKQTADDIAIVADMIASDGENIVTNNSSIRNAAERIKLQSEKLSQFDKDIKKNKSDIEVVNDNISLKVSMEDVKSQISSTGIDSTNRILNSDFSLPKETGWREFNSNFKLVEIDGTNFAKIFDKSGSDKVVLQSNYFPVKNGERLVFGVDIILSNINISEPLFAIHIYNTSNVRIGYKEFILNDLTGDEPLPNKVFRKYGYFEIDKADVAKGSLFVQSISTSNFAVSKINLRAGDFNHVSWNPSPEDSKLFTTKKFAEISVKAREIALEVSDTKFGELNDDLENIKTRLSTSEEGIKQSVKREELSRSLEGYVSGQVFDTFRDQTDRKITESISEVRAEMPTKLSSRNLVRNSLIKSSTNLYGVFSRGLSTNLEVGKYYYLSAKMKVEGVGPGKSARVYLQERNRWRFEVWLETTSTEFVVVGKPFKMTVDANLEDWHLSTLLFPEGGDRRGKVHIEWYSIVEIENPNMKILDWSRAPEDSTDNTVFEAFKNQSERTARETIERLTRIDREGGELTQIKRQAGLIEQRIETVRNNIPKINGGRNYLLGTENKVLHQTSGTSQQSLDINYSSELIKELNKRKGQKITISFDAEATNVTERAEAPLKRYGYEISLKTNNGRNVYINAWNGSLENLSGRFSNTSTIPANDTFVSVNYSAFYIQNNGNIKLSKPMLEFSDMPNDWSPALEDMVTTTEFHIVRDKANLHERILGSTETGAPSKIAQMVMSTDIFQVGVGKHISLANNLVYGATKLPKYISSVATTNHIRRVNFDDHDGVGINYTSSMSGWLGVIFPLKKRFVSQGERLSYRIEISVTTVPSNGRVLIQLIDNTPQANMMYNSSILINKTGEMVATGYIDIPRTGELAEYSLRFTLTTPGNVVFHKINIVEGDSIPEKFYDTTDYNSEYTRTNLTLLSDSYGVKTLSGKEKILSELKLTDKLYYASVGDVNRYDNLINGTSTYPHNGSFKDVNDYRLAIDGKWDSVKKIPSGGSHSIAWSAHKVVTPSSKIIIDKTMNAKFSSEGAARQFEIQLNKYVKKLRLDLYKVNFYGASLRIRLSTGSFGSTFNKFASGEDISISTGTASTSSNILVIEINGLLECPPSSIMATEADTKQPYRDAASKRPGSLTEMTDSEYLIRSDRIILDADTHIDKAFISKLFVQEMEANIVESMFGKFNKIISKSIEAEYLSSDIGKFVQALFDGDGSVLKITGDSMRYDSKNGEFSAEFKALGLSLYNNSVEAGFLQMNGYVDNNEQLKGIALVAEKGRKLHLGYRGNNEKNIFSSSLTIDENGNLIQSKPIKRYSNSAGLIPTTIEISGKMYPALTNEEETTGIVFANELHKFTKQSNGRLLITRIY